MKENKTEGFVNQINANVFFKEFTYSKNDFTDLTTSQKLEFADNVVWLDDLFFIFQIKDRKTCDNADDCIKWYNNKVINKGVKQIKSTIRYLQNYKEIEITNERGHHRNISQAAVNNIINKIIIYTPAKDFPDEYRFKRFYDSKDVGLIHLFHSEDYYNVCRYLITPAEVSEYLHFREDFYLYSHERSDGLPEQYLLAHFMETLNIDHCDPKYISNLNIKSKQPNFDMSYIIENFTNKITGIKRETDYYLIIAEIAKLNRAELGVFKKLFQETCNKCEKIELTLPYRVYFPRTDCGFVFIPLPMSKSKNWKTALRNFTEALKYDERAYKCVGVVVFKSLDGLRDFEMYWQYIKDEWSYDENYDKILKTNYPFRKSKVEIIDNRYK